MRGTLRAIIGGMLGAALAFASSGVPAQAASVKRIVDNGAVDCPNATDTTIATAVAAVGLGPGTITICAGDYPERFELNGVRNVKVISTQGARLTTGFGLFNTSLISISNSTNVTIQGLTLDGESNLANSGTIPAIAIYHSSVTLDHNTIGNWHEQAMLPGPLNGNVYGVYIVNDGQKLTIRNNVILYFQGFGISAFGPSKMTITGNYIGATAAGSAQPPSGIHISGNPLGGTVTGNTFLSDAFPTYYNGASALELYGVSKMKVSKNLISQWDFGIVLGTSCGGAPVDTSHNSITANTIGGVTYGIMLTSYAGSCDGHADYDKITGNVLTNSGGVGIKGILVDSQDGDPLNPPVATTTKATVTGNTISGFTTPIDVITTNGGVVSGKFSPNKTQ